MPITVGVGSCKLVAKLAGGGVGKPSKGGSGVHVVKRGDEGGVYSSLPAVKVLGKSALEGVKYKLKEMGVYYDGTIGDVMTTIRNAGMSSLLEKCNMLRRGISDDDKVFDRGSRNRFHARGRSTPRS